MKRLRDLGLRQRRMCQNPERDEHDRSSEHRYVLLSVASLTRQKNATIIHDMQRVADRANLWTMVAFSVAASNRVEAALIVERFDAECQ